MLPWAKNPRQASSKPEPKTATTGAYRMKDPEGDEGMFTGFVNDKGKAHGKGRLEYDFGYTFVGQFLHGTMDEGVAYDAAGVVKFTMSSGQWTSGFDEDIMHKLPSFFARAVDTPSAFDAKAVSSLPAQGNHKSIQCPAENAAVTTLCDFINENGDLIHHATMLEKMSPIYARLTRWMYKKQSKALSARRSASKLESSGHSPLQILASFVNSTTFRMISIGVILLNFVLMIIKTDWRMENLGDEDPDYFFDTSVYFTVYYCAEICLGFLANGSGHFCGPDMWWNWFDFVIVGASVADLLLISYFDKSSMGMACMRSLRFLRVSKLLRVFRAMRVFSELRLMIDMFINSCVFFIWCLLLLGLFLSLFAIFFVQGLTLTLQRDYPAIDFQLQQEILTYFGSVKLTMLSLFMAATGGNDWSVYHDVLKKAGPLYEALWIMFILFSLIAFFNVIGGVFCEKAMALARPTTHERMVEKRLTDEHDAAELSDLLHDLVPCDQGSTCRVTESAFDEFLDVPEVATYFQGRGLSTASAERLFRLLLDAEESDSVTFGKLISAVIKLDGFASSIDLHVLQVEMRKFSHAIQDQLNELNRRM